MSFYPHQSSGVMYIQVSRALDVDFYWPTRLWHLCDFMARVEMYDRTAFRVSLTLFGFGFEIQVEWA